MSEVKVDIGKNVICEICGKPGKLELSNIKDHVYTDDPDDYQYIHKSCHSKYDNVIVNLEVT